MCRMRAYLKFVVDLNKSGIINTSPSNIFLEKGYTTNYMNHKRCYYKLLHDI